MRSVYLDKRMTSYITVTCLLSPRAVASQCVVHCGNQRMCTQVQPTLIL